MEVKDVLFEALYKKYAYEFRIRHVRKVIKAKTPDLHEKLSELNKKIKEAREKKDYSTIGELTEKIAELRDKIAEATPLEHAVLSTLKEEKKNVDKSIRNFFKAIISQKEVSVPVERALAEGKPELALQILAGAAGGEGARGALTRPREVIRLAMGSCLRSVRAHDSGAS